MVTLVIPSFPIKFDYEKELEAKARSVCTARHRGSDGFVYPPDFSLTPGPQDYEKAKIWVNREREFLQERMDAFSMAEKIDYNCLTYWICLLGHPEHQVSFPIPGEEDVYYDLDLEELLYQLALPRETEDRIFIRKTVKYPSEICKEFIDPLTKESKQLFADVLNKEITYRTIRTPLFPLSFPQTFKPKN